jgi:soluble lytic murein transglycosylase-like protein
MVLSSQTAHSDIYSYKDKRGVTHITNIPKHHYKKLLGFKKSPFNKSNTFTEDSKPNSKESNPTAIWNQNKTVGKDLPDVVLSAEKDKFLRYDEIIRQASLKYQIPFHFIKAVIKVESNYNVTAVSYAGAEGLMQLMPGTAKSLGVSDSFDPLQNIFGGTKYLRILANKFNGDMVLTLASYNAGHGAVVRKEGVPYTGTDEYCRLVLKYYYLYLDREQMSEEN